MKIPGFKSLGAKFHIAIGQTFLLMSLLLSASFFGLVPDRVSAEREGRAAVAEAIAVNSSVLITQADMDRLRIDLQLVVERNKDILSAAVRKLDGTSVIEVGAHNAFWDDDEGSYSTDAQIRVPVWDGEVQWGEVQLRMQPPVAAGLIHNPLFKLIAFLAVSAFIAFYFYLGRMLKHLDPSAAIPARVRSALDTMAEGLVVIDLGGNIMLANQSFGEVAGRSPDDLMGGKVSGFDWVDTESTPVSSDDLPWTRPLRDGTPLRNGLVGLMNEEGIRRSFLVNCSPIMGGGKKHGGVLVSFDDITRLEEKEAELRKAKQIAEDASQSKSQFLANMSHEIRTPMNAILGFAEVLKRGYGRKGQNPQAHLDTIISSGQHLLELINDVLDLSKIEADRLEIEEIPCAAHTVVQDTLHVMDVKAKEQGITLDFEVQDRIPATVHTDPARLRQIVTNLVGNAIKFTSEGGVRVVMRMTSSAPDARLAIDVVDTGVGMEADTLEKVFDSFVQADSSITRRFGGTGLGLSISRRFAQALGGDITVASQPGEGSCFTATIAVGEIETVDWIDHDAAVIASDTISDHENMQWKFPPSRVLVVDDGDENRELITLVLEQAGLEIDCAENGQIAVDLASSHEYAVILMDMQMPVMDGFTATRTLREKGMDVPIIAFTAHAMKGFEKEILEVGCSGYLTKPVDIDLMFETLGGFLGGGWEPAEVAELEEFPTEAEPSGQVTETDVDPGAPIGSSMPVELPRIRAIVEKFVDRLGGKMDEMQVARAVPDFAELALLAHWLKGAGGTVGYDVFTEPAAELEQAAKAGDEMLVDRYLSDIFALSARVVVSVDDGNLTGHASSA